MSTICVPSVAEDCEGLRKAFSGWCTNNADEELIVSILVHIGDAIRQDFGKAYTEALDRKLTNEIERVMLLWKMEPAERDAYLVKEALWGWTCIIQVLVEISCTRSPEELLNARKAYRSRFKRSIEEDVAYHTSGNFRKLLVPLVSSYRYEGDDVDMSLAESEAKLLHLKISEKDYACDDIVRILTTRSKAQIQETLNQYKSLFGNDIKKDLKADLEDEFLWILRATVKCLVCPEKYFEKVIRLSFNTAMWTDEVDANATWTAKKIWMDDEEAFTRVVATRADFGIKIIKDEYPKMTSVQLIEHVISGHDYRNMLLALIGHQEGGSSKRVLH